MAIGPYFGDMAISPYGLMAQKHPVVQLLFFSSRLKEKKIFRLEILKNQTFVDYTSYCENFSHCQFFFSFCQKWGYFHSLFHSAFSSAGALKRNIGMQTHFQIIVPPCLSCAQS